MHIHMGFQFIVSSNGLLQGTESAQNFAEKIVQSRHTKPSMKQLPIHVAATLYHA